MQVPHAPRVVSLVLASLLAACDGPPRRSSATPAPAEQLARELAAANFAKDSRDAAWKALEPLIERSDATPTDLIDGACIRLAQGKADLARELLARAARAGESDARLQYNLGRVAEFDGDMQTAQVHYRRVLELAPDDLPTRFKLINSVQQSAPAEYERLLRQVVDRGIDNAGSWYMPAIYKLGLHLIQSERESEGERLLGEHSALKARKVPEPKDNDFDMGNFGRIAFPRPSGSHASGTGKLPTFAAAQTILPEFAGANGVLAADVDNDGDLDLLGWGERGSWLGLQGSEFTWTAQALAGGPTECVVALDLDGSKDDDVLDFVCVRQGALSLLRGQREIATGAVRWSESDKRLPALAGAPSDALAIDFDHEGDLDLLFVGSFGAALLRNDGAASGDPAGTFSDVTLEAGLPRGRAFEWCIAEDFDTDQDVDLWLIGADGSFLASNLRGGKFADESARAAEIRVGASEPIVADVTGDGLPDVWTSAGELYVAQLSGRWNRAANYALPELPELAARGAGELSLVRNVFALDFDLDGALDLLWSRPGPDGARLRGQLALGQSVSAGVDLALAREPRLVEDLDGDLAWDALAIGAGGLEIQRGTSGGNGAVRLGFRGKKDNRRGVGAVVELRAQDMYRRVFWRGEATLCGVGDRKEMDLVRVTWPNGVVQYELRRDLGNRASTASLLEQNEGLVGSCPFLYTWNGSEYEFISDVLGITPLGLPMAPGMLVPPDHDEFVLVRGDQLVPKDGVYELQFTEELREVTYLDRIRLDVVDHPSAVEVYPNELFCFPPFPAEHLHSVRAPLAPRAVGSDGRDWSQALSAIDDVYAAPFQPAPSQFLGLATPHFLELAFDKEALRDAQQLRLVLTGWFYWTDASVNMASARDPEQEFVPPLLQVPDGAGGWKPTGPPIGFPAGKTKSMVIDVSALLDRGDPRLRLFSTLRLYWDAIRLATDGDDAPREIRSLEPLAAELWERGFSDPEISALPDQPQRFDWERIAWQPRWDQHPGSYTKLGPVLPLLQHIDDRFVIMGAGDALTVRFDARELPPVREGWTRDYLVFLDGWAKDRDPNTVEALFVEPLPFHGMSAYPYGAGERFPDDAEHRAWRREWNTRPARTWLPTVTAGEPLPPARVP
ncbi:MAG: hypothetical protein IT454_21840 [Planctomycetes bacterium]|nr:hypothetical protein [Planctomycetota bacterium]